MARATRDARRLVLVCACSSAIFGLASYTYSALVTAGGSADILLVAESKHLSSDYSIEATYTWNDGTLSAVSAEKGTGVSEGGPWAHSIAGSVSSLSFFGGEISGGTHVINGPEDGAVATMTGTFAFFCTNTGTSPVRASASASALDYVYSLANDSDPEYNTPGAGQCLSSISLGGPGLHLNLTNPDKGFDNGGLPVSQSSDGWMLPGYTYVMSVSMVAFSAVGPSDTLWSDHNCHTEASWGVTGGSGSAAAIKSIEPASGLSGTWSSQSWMDGGSSTSAPNASGAYGYLKPQTAASTVSLDTNVTLGHLIIDSSVSHGYTISGTNTLTLSDSGGGSIDVLDGHHFISAPISAASDLVINVIPANRSLSVSSDITFSSGVGLYKEGAGVLNLLKVRAAFLNVREGLVSTSSGVSKVGALDIADGASFDIDDQSIIIDYSGTNSPIEKIRGYVASGYDGGSSIGTGLVSGQVNNNAPYFALGYAEASVLGISTWQGLSVDASAVIVDYCLFGDLDLDGDVDDDDLSILSSNYDTAMHLWTDGDVNYDGYVDYYDYLLLDQNYETSGRSALSAVWTGGLNPALVNDILSGGATTPEPSVFAMVLGLSAASLRRRH